MGRSIKQMSETVMIVHKCSRRQAINFLNSELTAKEFFSNVELTGYIPYPEDEDIN